MRAKDDAERELRRQSSKSRNGADARVTVVERDDDDEAPLERARAVARKRIQDHTEGRIP